MEATTDRYKKQSTSSELIHSGVQLKISQLGESQLNLCLQAETAAKSHKRKHEKNWKRDKKQHEKSLILCL